MTASELLDKTLNSNKITWTYKEICQLENKFYHSNIYYIKALLDTKFSPHKFTIAETQQLLKEVFN